MVASNLKFHPDAAFVVAGQPITHTQFFADIAAYQSKLTALKAGSHVVLFHPDTYQFAVRLFALACSGHNVILPPNGQHETLSLLLAQSAFLPAMRPISMTMCYLPTLNIVLVTRLYKLTVYNGQQTQLLFFIRQAHLDNLNR
ncbi:hypothetical protein P4S56_19175 [Pseudoalteromonas sp. Hal056]|uniref:hypothetical protein n=1 Tax=Pseudoalteromonas sp. Hal056 TaxID=3035159 RepID=UPI00301C2EBE